jgi:hypothetical protein
MSRIQHRQRTVWRQKVASVSTVRCMSLCYWYIVEVPLLLELPAFSLNYISEYCRLDEQMIPFMNCLLIIKPAKYRICAREYFGIVSL